MGKRVKRVRRNERVKFWKSESSDLRGARESVCKNRFSFFHILSFFNRVSFALLLRSSLIMLESVFL